MGVVFTDTGEVKHAGCVLEDRERNYHDDSDFYAVVWDEAKQACAEVEYATTRFVSRAHCEVDATPEVRGKAKEWVYLKVLDLLKEGAAIRACKPEVGRTVRVDDDATPKRHRGKVGVVTWAGTTRPYCGYGPDEHRVRIETAEGPAFFIRDCYAHAIDPENHLPSLAEIEAGAAARARVIDPSFFFQHNGLWYL